MKRKILILRFRASDANIVQNYIRMFEKIKIFLSESKQELKRVNWPRREETVRYTIFVIVLSIGIAIFLGILDYIFIQVLQRVIL